MKRIALLISLVGMLATVPLHAELRQLNITTFGMDCATCAHAMTVSIQKIPGVESVHVNINRGLVTVMLKPGNTVTMEQIRKAILNDAFTPKQARVVAVGELVHQGGKLQFRVTGSNEVFPVTAMLNKSWQQQVGHELTIHGLVSASGTLQIASVSAPSLAER